MIESDQRGLRPRPELAAMSAERLGLTEAGGLLDTLRRGLVERMSLAPQTRAALHTARSAGWSIVIVTNGTEAQQTAKIVHLDLDHLVDAAVISEAAGVRKPDPAIFALAATRAGTALDGGWMVGDSAAADIAGGAAVRLSTAWLRCSRTWAEPGFAPTIEVDTFAEAVRHLVGSG